MVGIRSPDGLVVGSCTSHPGVLGSIPKREEPGKTGAPCIKVPCSSRVPAPPWVGSRSPDSWDQIPQWAGGWACTSHPGVLGSIPKREEPGKTGAPCIKVPCSSRVPAPPWVGSRSPDSWDQIPQWAGGWACTSHPGVLGSIPKREEPGKTGAPCVKVPGSSRVPVAHVLPYPPPPHVNIFVLGPAVINTHSNGGRRRALSWVMPWVLGKISFISAREPYSTSNKTEY
jgi:hypothetical protein